MKRILAGSVVVAALLIGLVGPAAAGAPLVNFDYSPTSGPPGTVITASGNCQDVLPPRASSADAPAGFAGNVTLELSVPGGAVLDTATEPMSNLADWSAQVTVPAGTAAGEYDLDAVCIFGFFANGRSTLDSDFDSTSGGEVIPYATQVFAVTAQATTTTTTVGPTSTTGATSTTQPAVAAQAVRAAPSFTG